MIDLEIEGDAPATSTCWLLELKEGRTFLLIKFWSGLLNLLYGASICPTRIGFKLDIFLHFYALENLYRTMRHQFSFVLIPHGTSSSFVLIMALHHTPRLASSGHQRLTRR